MGTVTGKGAGAVQVGGDVAVVTGGSGDIGSAIAMALARDGMGVVLTYSERREKADAVAKMIRAPGGAAWSHHFEVADGEEVECFFREVAQTAGSPNVIVNNAGVIRPNLTVRSAPQDWDDPIAVNLTGSYNVIRRALRSMLARRYGRIGNVGSAAGTSGSITQPCCSASKAGLIGLTRSVAREVVPRGVICNVVAPGYIDSDLTGGSWRGVLTKQVPARRLGIPEDVAKVVDLLASQRAAYVTEAVVMVDGGVGIGY